MSMLFGLIAVLLISTVVIPVLFTVFDITTLIIPYAIYTKIFTAFDYFISILSPFMPLKFVLSCLFLIYLIKHSNIIFNLVIAFVRFIRG